VLQAAQVPDGIWVRPGYELSVAVDAINTPRFLEMGPAGTLFVSVPKEGKIYVCRDGDGDGYFEKVTPFLEGKDPKNIVQGMQFYDGSLWFAQLNTISRVRDANGDGKAEDEVQVLGPDQLPTGARGGHMWRALLIYKGRIYTHVGDQTNATDEPSALPNTRRSGPCLVAPTKLFASGVRRREIPSPGHQ
jgi:glucose/arabinose dehydrogenase